jgi:hypothetical protein
LFFNANDVRAVISCAVQLVGNVGVGTD